MDKDRLEIAVDWANECLGIPDDKDLFSTVAKVVLELVEENDTLRKGMEAFLNKTDYHREALKNEAAVRNENKVLSLKLEQAEADNAALVQALEYWMEWRAKQSNEVFMDTAFLSEKFFNLRNQPAQHHLNELTKLSDLAEATRTYRAGCECNICGPLAAIDKKDEDQ